MAVVYNDSVEGTSEKKYGQNYDWTKNKDLKEEVRNRLNKSGLGQIDDILRVLDGCDDDRFIDLAVREQVRVRITPTFTCYLVSCIYA